MLLPAMELKIVHRAMARSDERKGKDMTLAMFLGLLLIFGTLTSLLTEVAKKELIAAGRRYPCNLIVLAIALVIGIGGTAAAYVLFGIAFDTHNVVCMVLMGVMVWFGSMLGYDKVVQLITQFMKLGGKE